MTDITECFAYKLKSKTAWFFTNWCRHSRQDASYFGGAIFECMLSSLLGGVCMIASRCWIGIVSTEANRKLKFQSNQQGCGSSGRIQEFHTIQDPIINRGYRKKWRFGSHPHRKWKMHFLKKLNPLKTF